MLLCGYHASLLSSSNIFPNDCQTWTIQNKQWVSGVFWPSLVFAYNASTSKRSNLITGWLLVLCVKRGPFHLVWFYFASWSSFVIGKKMKGLVHMYSYTTHLKCSKRSTVITTWLDHCWFSVRSHYILLNYFFCLHLFALLRLLLLWVAIRVFC